jgi:hypothetical protein
VIDPSQWSVHVAAGERSPAAVWGNNLYTVLVYELEGGVSHLSFHRHDRAPIRDWRHVQQIKNETTSPNRWGLECYPDERVLTDTSNQYHLFVLADGVLPPDGVGWRSGCAVADPGDFPEVPNTRQRAWQPGLTTGRMGQREATLEVLEEARALMSADPPFGAGADVGAGRE